MASKTVILVLIVLSCATSATGKAGVYNVISITKAIPMLKPTIYTTKSNDTNWMGRGEINEESVLMFRLSFILKNNRYRKSTWAGARSRFRMWPILGELIPWSDYHDYGALLALCMLWKGISLLFRLAGTAVAVGWGFFPFGLRNGYIESQNTIWVNAYNIYV